MGVAPIQEIVWNAKFGLPDVERSREWRVNHPTRSCVRIVIKILNGGSPAAAAHSLLPPAASKAGAELPTASPSSLIRASS